MENYLYSQVMKIAFTISLFVAAVLFSSMIQPQQKPVPPGKAVYERNCLSCHQADGSGVPGMNPPLSQVSFVTGNKTQLIRIVLDGLTEPLEINGEDYHNPMPAQRHLSDQQLADVLTYIRSSFGNKADAVSVAEVKKVRTGK